MIEDKINQEMVTPNNKGNNNLGSKLALWASLTTVGISLYFGTIEYMTEDYDMLKISACAGLGGLAMVVLCYQELYKTTDTSPTESPQEDFSETS